MAEDHEMAQPTVIAHCTESQQGPQGFSGSWTGKHQKVAAAAFKLKSASQQLDQLLLPLPWLNLPRLNRGAALRGVVLGREVEANGCDITSREDESF